jgi:hypothetical protein
MKYNKRFLYHATQAENLVDIILLGIKAYDGWV